MVSESYSRSSSSQSLQDGYWLYLTIIYMFGSGEISARSTRLLVRPPKG